MGARRWFRGRQLFHRPGGGGWFQDDSGALLLSCTLFLLLYIRPISDHQASDRFQRLGNLALTPPFSGTWVFCLFLSHHPGVEVTTGFKSGCGGSASQPMVDSQPVLSPRPCPASLDIQVRSPKHTCKKEKEPSPGVPVSKLWSSARLFPAAFNSKSGKELDHQPS